MILYPAVLNIEIVVLNMKFNSWPFLTYWTFKLYNDPEQFISILKASLIGFRTDFSFKM